LSRFLWLWIPVFIFIVQIGIELWVPLRKYEPLHTENGPIELLQAYILLIAAIIAGRWLIKERKNYDLFLKVWIGIAFVGCVYVIGEEVSWGQHIFFWATPEEWAAINDQAETNIHNASSWFDQKPRILLEVGTIIGGLILPILAARKSLAWFPQWLRPIIPSLKMVVVASLFLVIKIMDTVGDVTDWVFIKRSSEVTEFYLYYFVLLYLYWLTNALRNPQR